MGRKLGEDRGASLVEYALLLALVAVVCVVAISFMGGSASGKLDEAGKGFGTTSTTDGEICNGLDDDGDGTVDEGVGTTWYLDGDGDGVGGSSTTTACTAPFGYVGAGGDTDDSDPTVQ